MRRRRGGDGGSKREREAMIDKDAVWEDDDDDGVQTVSNYNSNCTGVIGRRRSLCDNKGDEYEGSFDVYGVTIEDVGHDVDRKTKRRGTGTTGAYHGIDVIIPLPLAKLLITLLPLLELRRGWRSRLLLRWERYENVQGIK